MFVTFNGAKIHHSSPLFQKDVGEKANENKKNDKR
jgi:hypothetical protein